MPFHFGVIADEEEGKEKKKERRTKSLFLWCDFVTLTEVSETLGVVLHLNSGGLLVPKLKTWLRERFREAAGRHFGHWPFLLSQALPR